MESVALVKADEKIKEIKAKLQDGVPVTNGKMTLAELLDHNLNAQKRRVEAHDLLA